MSGFAVDLDTLELDTEVIEVPEVHDPIIISIPPRHGRDGKSVEPGEVARLVKDEVARIPRPKDGEPGKDAEPVPLEVVEKLIADAVGRIPRAKDGRDASVDYAFLAQMVQAEVAAIPKPKDGKDAAPVDPLEVARLVSDAVTRLPKPRDGRDGKDAESIPGSNGWTPLPTLETVGAKVFLKIYDWTGGSGEKPATGYVGEDDFPVDQRDAVNLRGPKGKPGEDGSSGGGRNGKSAYQIAVDNGFVGTEAEWLASLQGSGAGSPTVDAIADGNLSGHRAVRSTGGDRVAPVDSTDALQAGTVIGITLNAANDGDPVSLAVVGEIDEPSFSFSPGPVYFDNIGRLTQTLPTSGFIQQVAIALSTTIIVVQIGPPVILA